MRLILCAVGKLKAGPERELFEHYRERIANAGRGVHLGPLDDVELAESKARTVDLRRRDEGDRLLAAVAPADVIIALDERGKGLSSQAFSDRLAYWRDDGASAVALAIGGPDGHDASLRSAATMVLSLSPMTLPHGLARVVLAEQLYRAATILSGHPYHRA